MKSCIVFAVSIFRKDKLYVLHEFLSVFKQNFIDCDFYIGINYGSIDEVESVISEYNLNTYISRIENKNLYTGSDAGPYQLALKLLKMHNISYDLYWFAHTKGGVNSRDNERKMYLDEMFSERKSIENLFKRNTEIGSYALRGVSHGAAGDRWNKFNCDVDVNICSNIPQGSFKYTHVNWSYIETLFVINKTSVENFLNLITDKFFESKLHPCYFEVTFPWISTRSGYFPYIKYKKDFWMLCNLNDITKIWIEENKLKHLEKLLHL